MRSNKMRLLFLTASIFFSSLVLTGCAKDIFNFGKIQVAEYPSKEKINLRVELILTDDLCGYTWKNPGYRYGLFLGETFCENAEIVAKKAFKEIIVTKGRSVSSKSSVTSKLQPRLISVESSPSSVSWEDIEVVITSEWSLSDSEGNLIWINTIEGTGKSRAGKFVWKDSAKKRLLAAFSNMFSKTFVELSNSPEIREFASKH